MGMFALLVLVIFNFTYDLRSDIVLSVAPGALWVAFIFASLLGLGRTVAAEREVGSLDRLLLTPVDRKAIYLAKILPRKFAIYRSSRNRRSPGLCAALQLAVIAGRELTDVGCDCITGALGIASVERSSRATAFTLAREVAFANSHLSRHRSAVVISAVRARHFLLCHGTTRELLIVFDVIFISVSTLLFHDVVEE